MIGWWLACAAPSRLVGHAVGGDDADPGGPNGPGRGDPPVIAALDLVERPDDLEVHVETIEGDASLRGGTLLVQLDDDDPAELAIPDDLVSYERGEAVFLVRRPHVGECALGARHTVGVALADAAGRGSDAVEATIGTSDVGLVLPETGDTTFRLVGTLGRGALVCGELDEAANNGLTYSGDRDYIGFEVPAWGTYDFELRWDAAGDWDLLLFEYSDFDGYLYELDAGDGPALHGPEQASAGLYRYTTYVFEVAGWRGDAGAWTVAIE